MQAYYKPSFKKFVKKQAKPFQLAIEDEVQNICKKPDLCELKKSDLTGFRVCKFIFRQQEYLVAYTLQAEDVIFYMIGTHENFYRELKRYIKEGRQ